MVCETKDESISHLCMRNVLAFYNTRLENGDQISNLELKIVFNLF